MALTDRGDLNQFGRSPNWPNQCLGGTRAGWAVDIGSGEPYVGAVRTCVIVFSPVCLVLFLSSEPF